MGISKEQWIDGSFAACGSKSKDWCLHIKPCLHISSELFSINWGKKKQNKLCKHPKFLCGHKLHVHENPWASWNHP